MLPLLPGFSGDLEAE